MPPLETFEFQGCRLAYRIQGTGPPLIMIQGVGAYGTAWNPQIEILEKHYTCLTFDNRGIGASQPPATHLSVGQMAADTLALMDHVGWPSAHLVGHSLGGLIALEIALNSRPRILSLALLCSFARGADGTRLTPSLLWITLRMRFAPRRLRRKAFMELVVPPGETKVPASEVAERLSRVFGHDIADLPAISRQQLEAMKHHDVTPRLPELSGIPTLVISGDKDLIARPASGRAIAAGIPGARYIEIPGASHAFPVLEAERCAALLLEHLAVAEWKRVQSAAG
jgi:pimeloyl-ACP methyl ester carboxylesterase